MKGSKATHQNTANTFKSSLQFSTLTRKTRSLKPPPTAPTAPANKPVEDPSGLTCDQKRFLLCCGFFIKQAREQGREAALRATIEGRFFGEWSVPLEKGMNGAVLTTYRNIHRELDWVALSTRTVVPQSSWELVLAMPILDIFMHMRPSIAQYQSMQRRLGLDPSLVRAHHQDIYDRTTSNDEDAGNLTLGDGGSIDLTVDVEDEVYKDTRIDADP